MSQELAQSVALWRYQIIAPLLALAGPRGSLKSAIARLAAQTQQHPVSGPTRVAFGTIEEWLLQAAWLRCPATSSAQGPRAQPGH
jgi:hypothetical protein